jgi:hypothetical protein
MRVVIVANSPRWTLLLHLSGRLAYDKLKWVSESEEHRRVWIANKGTPWKRGGLYFKPSMDACMSSNPKALHKCLWIVTRKIFNEIQQDCDEFK